MRASIAVGVALLTALSLARLSATGSWEQETAMPSAIQEVSVASLSNLVYAIGGSSFQVRSNQNLSFDPGTHSWSTRAPYPGTARDHMSLVANGGFLYLMGGVTAWPQPSVATVQRYDPATDTWTTLAPLPVARGAMGVAVINGKIYAAGGLEAGVSVADFTVYDPSTNAWSALPSMPTARDHLTGAALNGKFYAIGGRNGNTCAPLTTVEVFDPSANTWSTAAPMTTARGGHAAAAANGHIQVFGGEGAPSTCGVIASAEEYDPLTNTWAALPSMPTPRHGTGGGLVNGSIYLPGGATAAGDAPTAVHERFDDTTSLGPLPTPWSNQDIGRTGAPGTAGATAGTFNVQGAGSDIWGSADSLQFVFQPLSGDGQITARVLGLENTNSFAKAGVMIRAGLTAGSASVILDMKPSGGVEFMARPTSGAQTSFLAGASTPPPPWLRLTRAGSTISAATSVDGTTWTPVGSTTVSMATSVYVGLAVTSHVSGVLAMASFDNVSVSGGTTTDLPPSVSLTSPANGASYAAPATVPLSASASDADGTVTRVDFLANGSIIGTSTASPFSFSWTNVASGSYTLTAVATDNAGLQTTSAAVSIAVTGSSSGPLPSPWANQDIGSTGAAGSASYSNGTFTILGSGADIWGTADAFQYVFQPLAGDGQITARLTGIQNTSAFAKIGVMFRQSLTAGAAEVILDLKASGGLEFMDRPTTGAQTAFITGASASPPAWVRLSRSGSSFVASTSPDGNTWTQLGSVSVTMPSSVYVGLAVTSHSAGVLATGTADNVAVTAAVADVPPTVTLTSPSNGATFTAPATVNLAANASDADGTVTRVDFFANGSLVATASASPFAATWTGVPAGSYTVTASATDNAGLQTTSSGVGITVNVSSPGPLPSPWTDRDIGSVGVAGSASASNGVFTVSGAGSDIWGTADAFDFAYQALPGDGQITARVTGIQNTNAFAKAGVMIRQALTAGSAHVILDLKPLTAGLEFMTRAASGGSTAFVTSAIAQAPVWVRLVRSGSTIAGYTSMDGTNWAIVGSMATALTGTVYAGLAVTSHTTSSLNTSTFDNVSVGPPSVTPPASLNFSSRPIAVQGTASGGAVSIPNLAGPTSLTVGPDGRLYVSVVDGRLFVLTLDSTKLGQAGQTAVTHVQELDDIYLKPSVFCNIGGNLNDCQPQSGPGTGRQVTGIAIDPKSTASQVTLYVSNSNLGSSTIDLSIYPFSGTITRLVLQPDSSSPGDMKVTGNTDLVVGMPRSREAHSPNGMSIGPDGWLYIGVGGNTNAGQPSSFFGNLAEYYLSGSVLRLNLAELPSSAVDVTNVRTASDMTPYQGVFELYATGLRNPYDLVWHSNGKLYVNDNGANATQGNTPATADGCPSTPSIDPGDHDDSFNLVVPGKYYGHPVPVRQQCVFLDGTVYSPPLAPDPNWVPPLASYFGADSTDGIVEYQATAFAGTLLHALIAATFSDDQLVRRITLSPDGSAVEGIVAIGKFNQPLDVWTDTSGNIFVAEYAGNQISVIVPK